MIGFNTSDKKGFHITFENGWTVSVQFGYGNYGDNYDWRPESRNDPAPKSTKAEIAAWDASGDWYKFEGDNTVEGYQTPAEVLAFMNMIAAKGGEA